MRDLSPTNIDLVATDALPLANLQVPEAATDDLLSDAVSAYGNYIEVLDSALRLQDLVDLPVEQAATRAHDRYDQSIKTGEQRLQGFYEAADIVRSFDGNSFETSHENFGRILTAYEHSIEILEEEKERPLMRERFEPLRIQFLQLAAHEGFDSNATVAIDQETHSQLTTALSELVRLHESGLQSLCERRDTLVSQAVSGRPALREELLQLPPVKMEARIAALALDRKLLADFTEEYQPSLDDPGYLLHEFLDFKRSLRTNHLGRLDSGIEEAIGGNYGNHHEAWQMTENGWHAIEHFHSQSGISISELLSLSNPYRDIFIYSGTSKPTDDFDKLMARCQHSFIIRRNGVLESLRLRESWLDT